VVESPLKKEKAVLVIICTSQGSRDHVLCDEWCERESLEENQEGIV
jgi:hypothetical protein